MSLLLLFQSVQSDNWALGVSPAEIQPDGQTFPLNIGAVLGQAEFDIDGQDVGLTLSELLSVPVDAATFSIDGQAIQLVIPVTEDQPSGGHLYFRQEQERLRKEYEREREREDAIQLAERLEKHLIETGSLEKPDTTLEVQRLRAEVEKYRGVVDLPNRVQRALNYADKARTELAYQIAYRELEKMQNEEDLALLMVLALD